MIKVILILSSVMLIATAIFGVLNRQFFMEEVAAKTKANEEYKVVNRELIQNSEKLQDTQENLKSSKDERDEQDAKMTLGREKLSQKEKAVKELMATLDEQNLTLKEFQVILDKYKGKSLEDLKDDLEKNKAAIVERNVTLQELEGKVAAANAAVDVNEKTLKERIETQKDRGKAMERNGFEATITAVNNDWGFVIIDAGQNRGLSADSPLLVSAMDGTRVGKLNIISVERTITVADIDRESMEAGAVIQPGYRVVYEKIAE